MKIEIPPPVKALSFIQEMKDLGDKFWNEPQIQHFLELIYEDLENKSILDSQRYLEHIFFTIPPKLFPYLLDHLTHRSEGEIGRKIILYLLRTDRPIYQIKALQMIITRGKDNFAPYIIPLIFSGYNPLKHQAIITIIKVPGSAELILEQILNDRSKKRQRQAMQLLRKLNPTNHKLALKMLESDDFIDRIDAINHLAETNDSRWIATIEKFLNDSDIAVQKAAIEGITRIGGTKAKKILTEQLDSQDFPPLRRLLSSQIQELDKKN